MTLVRFENDIKDTKKIKKGVDDVKARVEALRLKVKSLEKVDGEKEGKWAAVASKLVLPEKMGRQQQISEKRMSEMTEDDPGESPSTSSGLGSQPAGSRSRVAHSPSSGPAVLSKAKQQLVAREKAKEVMAAAKQTTAITNVKGTQRKAHTPSSAVVRKPFVTPDPNSKVPTTVRQKYLDTIIQECLKISGGDELEAYTRAEREEANCCRKASSRMLYLNLVVSTIKKLRAEATAAAALVVVPSLRQPPCHAAAAPPARAAAPSCDAAAPAALLPHAAGARHRCRDRGSRQRW